MTVDCPVCRNEFEPKSNLAVYCGALCRQKAYRGRVAELLQEARGVDWTSKRVVKSLKATSFVLPKESINRLSGETAIDFAIRKAEYKER